MGSLFHIFLRESILNSWPTRRGIAGKKCITDSPIFRFRRANQMDDKFCQTFISEEEEPIVALSQNLHFFVLIVSRKPVAMIAHHTNRKRKTSKLLGGRH